MNKDYKDKLLNPGHSACAGCGQLLAVRHVMDSFGPNTIVAGATGCLEVTTTKYGESAWGVPYIHSLFENPSAVASGILAGLNYKKSFKAGALTGTDPTNPTILTNPTDPNVVVLAGDGSTFDIGFGLLAGMFERKENITYVCFDNEGYQNTGAQSSGSSPFGSNTTTTPIGRESFGVDLDKKNMISFALSQNVPYVATASVANIIDLKNKIEESKKYIGPKYIQVLVPCVPGWGIDAKDTIKIAKLAVETGFYPIIEYANGILTKKTKIKNPAPKIEEYLKLQARFKHLFKKENGAELIAKLQSICDENIKKYELG